jgi:hypothetical protein
MTTDITTGTGGESRRARAKLSADKVHDFMIKLFGEDLHAKRVLSLANGVTGVVYAAAASVHAIGQALATARSLDPKHAVKQVDRMLSNAGIEVWALFAFWAPFVLAGRKEVVVALDWTEFDADGQATIAAYLVTSHGRATPLLWKTVKKDALEGRRNEYEDEILVRLAEVLPSDVQATILADRGFGDQKLYEGLERSGLKFVIRFREVIRVENDAGEGKPGGEWIPTNGRARLLKNARVTQDRFQVPAVVCVKAKSMKEGWCLASNHDDKTAKELVRLYGKRFTIEETFRDQKDIHFGMGLSATRIGQPARRDRLLFLLAIAQALLTLLGAAGEKIGIDKHLKSNTSPKRQYSLFRQGCYWFSALPTMKSDRFEKLMVAFGEMVSQHAVFVETFGII